MHNHTKTEKKCKVCTNAINTDGLYESLANRLLSVGICHNCDTWMGEWQDRNDQNVARINGEHYRIGDENAKFKGMSGNIIAIKFNDGRVIQTDNLWHQGTIPKQFTAVLFNNAAFVER